MAKEPESAALPKVTVRRLPKNSQEEANPVAKISRVAIPTPPAAPAPSSDDPDLAVLKVRLRQLARSVRGILERQDRLAAELLSRPERRSMTRLMRAGARTVRRKRLELSPAPSFDVERRDDEWCARSDASEVSLAGQEVPRGWIRLSMNLAVRGGAALSPRLLIQVAGAQQPLVVTLPPAVDGRLDTFLELPNGTVALRLRPTERPAAFSISDVRVTEVTAAEVAARGALRLLRGAAASPQQPLSALLAVAKSVATLHPSRASELLRREVIGTAPGLTYAEWSRRYVTLSDLERTVVREWIDTFHQKPTVSIHLAAAAVSDPIAAIASMQRQLYPHWELLVTGDDGLDSEPIWRRAAEADARVRWLDKTTHPIDAARGELFLALTPELRLAEQALAMFAHHLVTTGDAAVTFDEEIETASGAAPVFRPQWDEDLFLGNDYVRGAVCFTRSFLLQLRHKPEGAGRALALDALTELVGHADGRIGHLPFVLARRTPAPSAEQDTLAVAALERHAARVPGARITRGLTEGTFRVLRRGPERLPLVSLIIPTRDKQSVLELAIESLLARTRYPSFELIIVDNQSREQSSLRYLRELQRRPDVRVLRYRKPFNYAAINNVAFAASRGELIGLLNNDLEIISGDWLHEMVAQAMRPEVGAVGAKLYYPDQTIQHGGVTLGLGGVAAHLYRRWTRDSEGSLGRLRSVHQTSAVTGACLVTRRDVYERLGGLDARNLPVAFNDVDFCLRVREAGLRVIWTPYAELFHHESLSRGAEDTPEKLARFSREIRYMQRRWGAQLEHDPFYSPNLSLQGTDLGLAFPPRVRAPWLSTSDSITPR